MSFNKKHICGLEGEIELCDYFPHVEKDNNISDSISNIDTSNNNITDVNINSKNGKTNGIYKLNKCEAIIVESARVSYSGMGTKKINDDVNLIDYLYRHQHLTPFEMPSFIFRVKCPIFVARQWMRHRTFSYNEISGRYSILDSSYFKVDKLYNQSKENHQGRSDVINNEVQLLYEESCKAVDKIFEIYEKMCEMGVSKEQARMNLPLSTYTTFYAKANLRNLLSFLSLRRDSSAQQEIRVYADAIYEILKNIVPHVMNSYDNYNNGLFISSKEIIHIKPLLNEENLNEYRDNLKNSKNNRRNKELLFKLNKLSN